MAMALDIYGIGSVLYRKKYRFLSYGYRIFPAGLIPAFFTVPAGRLKRRNTVTAARRRSSG